MDPAKQDWRTLGKNGNKKAGIAVPAPMMGFDKFDKIIVPSWAIKVKKNGGFRPLFIS